MYNLWTQKKLMKKGSVNLTIKLQNLIIEKEAATT